MRGNFGSYSCFFLGLEKPRALGATASPPHGRTRSKRSRPRLKLGATSAEAAAVDAAAPGGDPLRNWLLETEDPVEWNWGIQPHRSRSRSAHDNHCVVFALNAPLLGQQKFEADAGVESPRQRQRVEGSLFIVQHEIQKGGRRIGLADHLVILLARS